jgi:glycosyltransferase involved in cell wall biosynthesis
MTGDKKVSLVVPVRNEEASIGRLLESISAQTIKPDEVIIVDGGSADRTAELVEKAAAADSRIRLIRTGGAGPGLGRNIGIEAARNEWVALTDAGIRLEPDWLEKLSAAADGADVVYGNYAPVINGWFDKCAAIAYVPPARPGRLRGQFIASSMLRRRTWQDAGRFPDLRAAEDLIFMEKAKSRGAAVRTSPAALVHWSLQPGLLATFRKFVLYSRHNAWIGRQWDWHHGIARQYAVLLPIFAAAMFFGFFVLLAIPVWLAARAVKRIYAHRYQFGRDALTDPRIFPGVMLLILTIDAATFIGWAQAVLSPAPVRREGTRAA